MAHSYPVLSTEGIDYFAPYVFNYCGQKRMLLTTGKTSDKIFKDKTWTINPNKTQVEKWYVSGKNSIEMFAETGPNKWKKVDCNIPEINKFEDVMGCSLVTFDQSYYLYFSAKSDSVWKIYVSTSNDVINWGIPQVAMEPSISTDCEHVFMPSVVVLDNTFYMWYAGRDFNNRRIHYSTSKDGYHWLKQGAVLNLGALGDPDDYATDCPSVLHINNLYIMAYGGGLMRGIMLATSSDGRQWNRLGPEIFRGKQHHSDHLYAFYPCLYQNSDTTFELFYAGESVCNEWSILSRHHSYSSNDLDTWNSYQANEGWRQKALYILNEVPSQYYEEPEDCHQETEKYSNEQEGIEQIRPSSTPLFKVKYQNTDVASEVIKLGRSREHLEAEMQYRNQCKTLIPMVPASIQYIGQRPVLVMPYLDQTMELASLAGSRPTQFMNILTDLLNCFVALTQKTMIPYDPYSITHTGQTPEIMQKWLHELEEQTRKPLFDKSLVVNGHKTENTIRLAVVRSIAHIGTDPDWISLYTGDNHFRNFLVDERDDFLYYAIDFEFSGYIDIDYSVAKFIGSAIKHLNSFQNVKITEEKDMIYVDFEYAHHVFKTLLETDWFFDKFKSLPINYNRVYAMLISKMYFRLNNVLEQPKEQALKHLAMVTIATRLFDESFQNCHG